MEMIKFPNKVWKNEFEQRLSNIDRYFMYTIYTLTDTYVEIQALENAFNHAIKDLDNIDITINHFDNTIKRLSKSLVKLIARNKKLVATTEHQFKYVENYEKEISVLNPSVNDYLRVVFKNTNIKNFFLNNYLYFEQLARLTQTENEFWIEISKVIKNKELLNIKAVNPEIESSLQLYIIVKQEILDMYYESIIMQGLKNFPVSYYNESIRIFNEKMPILKSLFSEPFWSFYHIEDIIKTIEGLESIFSNLDIHSLVEIINKVYNLMQNGNKKFIKILCKISYKHLKKAAQSYADKQSSEMEDEYYVIVDSIINELYDILEPLEDIGIDYETIIENVNIGEWFTDESNNREANENFRQYEDNEIDLILDRDI
ncbi:MAG: hypothetical protein VB128_00310 [Sedimentibacter saalensis]|uniref:hypothetical protein n=1 Tax=Sedimentibacter saalensis TaxID=130788 RepID=UPI002B1EEEE2|nr:hypothetical protein [Sedimentibacter saalensis]MEA5093373.1 hypothetical protein [Sedimentibacter saalensis]